MFFYQIMPFFRVIVVSQIIEYLNGAISNSYESAETGGERLSYLTMTIRRVCE